MPKKEILQLAKCQNHINLILNHKDEVIFFNQREGPYYPTLRTLHRVGDFMPKIKVDTGAVKFIISGANVMCGGINTKTSDTLSGDTPVEILAASKQLPLAIGLTTKSTEEMDTSRTGAGVNVLHVLGDGLWTVDKIL